MGNTASPAQGRSHIKQRITHTDDYVIYFVVEKAGLKLVLLALMAAVLKL